MTIHEPELTTRGGPALVSVDGRTYPLESVRLTARAEGGLALSRLTQRFANPYDQTLEVVYTLPLPAEGAVLGYTIRIGERVLRGIVEPRERAAAAFRQALAQGRGAGLLEQDRDDTFRQRLGNLPPATPVEVEIEVLQRLATLAATDALGLEWEYRFPTVVGVRYQGAPDRVPDAGRLDVDRDEAGGIPTRLAIDVTVAGRTPATTRISSPSHSILCEAGPEGARVRFGEGERLDRDLVLRWPAAADGLEAGMVLGGGLAGDDGRYGLVTVTPPAVPRATFARDLTVLIDASGSMSGEPLACAKQVVQELLRGLDPQDRFELLVFSNQVSRLGRAMTPATPDALRRAQRALAELTAGGGTEMAGAISEALGCLRHDAQRQIVLVTDGQIGFEREVVAGIMNGLPDGCRVHAVGIGSAPNRSLTAAVARAGRGVELLVNDPVSAREGARRLGAATARPVITDVAIEGTALLRPATTRLRDVFAGQPLVAAVELRGHGGALELHGRLAGSAERWTWRIAVPEAGGASVAPPARATPKPSTPRSRRSACGIASPAGAPAWSPSPRSPRSIRVLPRGGSGSRPSCPPACPRRGADCWEGEARRSCSPGSSRSWPSTISAAGPSSPNARRGAVRDPAARSFCARSAPGGRAAAGRFAMPPSGCSTSSRPRAARSRSGRRGSGPPRTISWVCSPASARRSSAWRWWFGTRSKPCPRARRASGGRRCSAAWSAMPSGYVTWSSRSRARRRHRRSSRSVPTRPTPNWKRR